MNHHLSWMLPKSAGSAIQIHSWEMISKQLSFFATNSSRNQKGGLIAGDSESNSPRLLGCLPMVHTLWDWLQAAGISYLL
jgi:hypothetical protein